MNAEARWTPTATEDGSWTLFDAAVGEACHSLAGAWTQARERYAAQIDELAAERPGAIPGRRVRLLDVGTGLGLNLAAALERCEARGLVLEATRLELHLGAPRAALSFAREQGSASASHARVLGALERWLVAEVEAGGIPAPGPVTVELPGEGGTIHRIEFVAGDARLTLPALAPERRFDLVVLDPFSPRADPALWEGEFLAEIARRMEPFARLSTYSSSMRVRTRLAAAGLAVGAGPRVGRKAEGTLASRGGAVPPLAGRTARRLERATRGLGPQK